MKLLTILFVSLISLGAKAADDCIAITKDKLCIQLEWNEGPYLGAYSKNTVKFKDITKSTESETIYTSPKESVQFFGWMVMASHQHGTRPVTTNVLEEGIYENSKIFYMSGMMGTWQFKVKLGSEEFVLHALDI